MPGRIKTLMRHSARGCLYLGGVHVGKRQIRLGRASVVRGVCFKVGWIVWFGTSDTTVRREAICETSLLLDETPSLQTERPSPHVSQEALVGF
jgi:hypothetical protein